MNFFVCMIAAKKNNQLITYVGYTNNLNNRLKKHNTGRAKSTRGLQWFIFSKNLKQKNAMKYEYFKKNRSLRSNIKKNI